MTSKLYEIVSKIMNTPISQINDSSGPESIETWDSFNVYILLNEIEVEFNIRFTLDESLDIKNVGDFKRHLKNHGVDV
ncbi:MAG: acyl carrier protein [Thaumarchaeota archaeon]|nr:acyl carrier protein [Nitrososphaerota archaeon]